MTGAVLSLSFRLLFRRIGLLLAGNAVWLLLSLLVVTWPAATAGLFHLVHRVVQEERGGDPREARLRDFWQGLRRHAWPGYRLILANLAVLAVLASAFWFYGRSPVDLLRWIAVPVGLLMVAWLGAQVYLIPLLTVHPRAPVRQLLLTAWAIAVTFPGFTLGLLLAQAIVALIAVALAGPALLLLAAWLALVQTLALRLIRVARGEIPPGPAGTR